MKRVSLFTLARLAFIVGGLLGLVGDLCLGQETHNPTNEAIAPSETNAVLAQAIALYDGAKGVDQNVAKAVKLLQTVAESGDPEAMCRLAFAYEDGVRVNQDIKQGMIWWEKAAKKGHVLSMLCLAERYDKAWSIPRDYDKAVHWYKQAMAAGSRTAPGCLCDLLGIYSDNAAASDEMELITAYRVGAERGDPRVQFELGNLYLAGEIVEKDTARGVALIEAAAGAGFRDAIGQMADLYEKGEGVPQSAEKAGEWKKKAAQHGDGLAMLDIAERCIEGENGEPNYGEAVQWLHKAAMAGDLIDIFAISGLKDLVEEGHLRPDAYVAILRECADNGNDVATENLAGVYEEGKYVDKDINKAIELFSKAGQGFYFELDSRVPRLPAEKAVPCMEKRAALGDTFSMNELGRICLENRDVPGMAVKAFMWYEKAAHCDDLDGMVAVARMYAKGLGVQQDYSRAVRWYLRASKSEYFKAQAMLELADFYEKGLGVDRNLETAAMWRDTANGLTVVDITKTVNQAKSGNKYAMYAMAEYYAHVRRTPENTAKALEWYTRAGESGHEGAMRKLAQSYDYRGHLGPKDIVKSIYWYEKLAEMNDVDAMLALGRISPPGKNKAAQRADRQEWYARATKVLSQQVADGDPDAMQKLGRCYLSGDGVIADYAKALRLLRQAYEEKKAVGYDLALLYLAGRGVRADIEKAMVILRASFNRLEFYEVDQYVRPFIDYYRQEANMGSAHAMYLLGSMYRYGMGLEKDNDKAQEWFAKAARLGHKPARQCAAGKSN
ncbi:MAG: sel1 repeat family protein [Phycisphaerae bacterium]|nr:sel1 repeat family protein [Phycisphaerae bacterium]